MRLETSVDEGERVPSYHLDVLEWAVANGCPWNPAQCEHLPVLELHIRVWIRRWRRKVDADIKQ